MNPFEGLASYLLGRLEQKLIQNWVKLVFQMMLSSVISFLFICGSVMLSGTSLKVAVASGMVTVSVVLTVFARRSPQLRGMMFVLPGAEAAKEIATDLQTIQTAEERKK